MSATTAVDAVLHDARAAARAVRQSRAYTLSVVATLGIAQFQ